MAVFYSGESTISEMWAKKKEIGRDVAVFSSVKLTVPRCHPYLTFFAGTHMNLEDLSLL